VKARGALKAAGGVLLAGGVAMAGAELVVMAACATGKAQLDRWAIRGRVALECLRTFGPKVLADPTYPRAMMLIIERESGGNPSHYLGDATLGGGPSIGAGNVYRTTAKDLGLWTPPEGATIDQERAAYAALASDEALGIRWAVKVFASKLKASGGDVPLAIRLYNGSGTAAESYRAAVLSRASDLGWSLA